MDKQKVQELLKDPDIQVIDDHYAGHGDCYLDFRKNGVSVYYCMMNRGWTIYKAVENSGKLKKRGE